jgi:hypothetical protein
MDEIILNWFLGSSRFGRFEDNVEMNFMEDTS